MRSYHTVYDIDFLQNSDPSSFSKSGGAFQREHSRSMSLKAVVLVLSHAVVHFAEGYFFN